MATDRENRDAFAAMARKHETTIRRIGATFYKVGSYNYDELVNDLTTYLWMALSKLPPDAVIHDEHAWVYVILHRHALDHVRNERTYHRRLLYGADLSVLADDFESDPFVSRLYRLIDELDEDDKEIILLFIDHVSIKQIGLQKGMDYLSAHRRLVRIYKKLRKLDKIIDNDID